MAELTTGNMSERQRGYRKQYRDRIAGWYDGRLHVAVIYAIGAGAFYIYLSHLQDVRWWEWLTVPVVFSNAMMFLPGFWAPRRVARC